MSNPTELPDLDKLEALSSEVDSFPETLQPFVSMGGQVVIHTFSMAIEQVNKVAALYDALTPSAVLALVAAARRAQPEGEAPQAEPPRMNTDESREYLIKFMEKHFTDRTYHRYIRGERGSVNLAGDFAWQMARALRMLESAPAATLSPLCGAQHAESGKEAIYQVATDKGFAWSDVTREIYDQYAGSDYRRRIVLAAQQATPTPRVIGGQRWSKEADMTEGWLAAQQAAAPEDVDLRKDEATRLRRVVRAMGIDHQVPGNDAQLRDCLFSVLGIIAGKLESAPGTPEAPSDKHLPYWERGIATVTLNGHQLREALDFINPDGEGDSDQLDDDLTFGIVQHEDDEGKPKSSMCCWNDDTDGVLPLDSEPRAGQLDGGQEGSD